MDPNENKRRIAQYGMKALERALEVIPDTGALMPMLFTQTGGATELERVDMQSPEESLKTAQILVMERAANLELYAIAYVGVVQERAKNDFTASAAENWRSAMQRGQAALLVEAGDRHEPSAMLMAAKMLRDDEGPFLESRPSAFTGTINWLAEALKS